HTAAGGGEFERLEVVHDSDWQLVIRSTGVRLGRTCVPRRTRRGPGCVARCSDGNRFVDQRIAALTARVRSAPEADRARIERSYHGDVSQGPPFRVAIVFSRTQNL